MRARLHRQLSCLSVHRMSGRPTALRSGDNDRRVAPACRPQDYDLPSARRWGVPTRRIVRPEGPRRQGVGRERRTGVRVAAVAVPMAARNCWSAASDQVDDDNPLEPAEGTGRLGIREG